MANKFDIDIAKLESLSRFVSSPSVNRDTAVRTVGKDGEESIKMKVRPKFVWNLAMAYPFRISEAVWIEPHFRESSRPQIHAKP